MSRKYFGTDGVRGRVGQFPMTPECVQKVWFHVLGYLCLNLHLKRDCRLLEWMFTCKQLAENVESVVTALNG